MEGNIFNEDPVILMKKAKNGEVVAFNQLYNFYFTPVFRYIYLRVKNREETEDLTQSVFLKFYQSTSEFQDRNKSPLAYFFTVARNTVIDYWRKNKHLTQRDDEEKLANLPDMKDNPQESAEKGRYVDLINQSLRDLTEEQQEAIILKYINDLSARETAELMGKSEEAVRQLQCRAIKILRQKFNNLKIL